MPETASSVRSGVGAPIRRALLAYGLTAFVEFATWLAILLVAYRKGGPVYVGVASVVMLVPAIVLIPFVAGVGDRMRRSRALALTHVTIAVTSTLTGLMLVLDAPLWAMLVVATLLNIAVGVARPMHFAMLPLLAQRPGDVVSANALSSTLDGVALLVGYVLAGVLTDYLGAWTVLMLCAALAVCAALLTGSLRTPVAHLGEDDVPGRILEALGGFISLRRSAGAITLLLMIAVMSVVEGANDTLTITFNDQVLGLTESTAGIMAGAYGLGLAIGGVVIAALARRRRLAPIIVGGALLMGLAQAAISLLDSLAPTVIVLTLIGVGISMIIVSARTLLQRSTDDAVLARVMGVQEGVELLGLTLGAVVGPLLVEVMGARQAFLPLGALVALFGLLSFAAIRGLDARSVPREEEITLLRRVPFLSALQPYELERLAQRAAWVDVAPGSAVITQGEIGDCFYVVDSGELSVAVDGVVRHHRMAPGDGFGEIALLHEVPRTASIRALSRSRLLRISAEDFLSTVVPNASGAHLARTLADARRRDDERARNSAAT
jgi:MFS family permease